MRNVRRTRRNEDGWQWPWLWMWLQWVGVVCGVGEGARVGWLLPLITMLCRLSSSSFFSLPRLVRDSLDRAKQRTVLALHAAESSASTRLLMKISEFCVTVGRWCMYVPRMDGLALPACLSLCPSFSPSLPQPQLPTPPPLSCYICSVSVFPVIITYTLPR